MTLDFSKGAAPLYYQLEDIIKEKIMTNEYEVGQKIETEKELEEKYQLSRITVRQALNELVQKGYLLRQRGKGTIVLGQNLFKEQIVKVKSFTEEMRERGLEPGTLSINVSLLQANAAEAEKLKINEGEEFYKIERVRTANDIPIVVFETYLPNRAVFSEEKLRNIESLYAFMKQHHINIQRTSECFEVGFASKTIAEELEVEEEFPLMLRTRQSFDSKGHVVEYTIAHYHSKLYKIYMEMEGI
ncbi:GntR family transcriptional regulator [Salibacterium aidingense]|uniref:GntR family transcriptional regulator n=1 Tax=Salibacterium aidingense TaxID=384933 RepID=UPI000412AB95|nr:GntR family transcriptional regulator [Salibacterium aidingense]